MSLVTHREASNILGYIMDCLKENYFEKLTPVKGYFRKDSYEWTVFTLVEKDDEWELTIIENVQHEGFCLERLGFKQTGTSKKSKR